MIRMAADGDRMVEGGNQAGLARAAGWVGASAEMGRTAEPAFVSVAQEFRQSSGLETSAGKWSLKL